MVGSAALPARRPCFTGVARGGDWILAGIDTRIPANFSGDGPTTYGDGRGGGDRMTTPPYIRRVCFLSLTVLPTTHKHQRSLPPLPHLRMLLLRQELSVAGIGPR